MPSKPLTICNKMSCNNLTRNKYCDEHIQTKPNYDTNRGTAAHRGYGARWQKVRKQYLSKHPVCVRCGYFATVVDHITPHKGDYGLFWDRNNWQPLRKPCHDRKTATEDGGFGR